MTGLLKIGTLLAVFASLGLSSGGSVAAAERKPAANSRKDAPMQLLSTYPVVVTDKLAECRDFYVRWFGFQVGFEASWFVYLSSTGERPHEIAFMASHHPSQPPGPETFNGQGTFLTFQVADAATEFERLQRAGLPIAYPLRDEAWGQRRFGLFDPAGMWVDVVQQIEPAPGYWEKYMR